MVRLCLLLEYDQADIADMLRTDYNYTEDQARQLVTSTDRTLER